MKRLIGVLAVIALVAVCVRLAIGIVRLNTLHSATVAASQLPPILPQEGEIVPICREWTNSASAFERDMATNLWVVYERGEWRVRTRKNDGTAIPLWESDRGYDSPQDAAKTFAVNIDWHVLRAICDAFAGLNQEDER